MRSNTTGPFMGLIIAVRIDWSALFGNDYPVVLEIGFGNGQSLVQQAMDAPEQNFFAIEVHSPGVGHCLQTCHEANLTNVKLCNDDAVMVLNQQLKIKVSAAYKSIFQIPGLKNVTTSVV